jgi:hypothetical protein
MQLGLEEVGSDGTNKHRFFFIILIFQVHFG